jgi:pyridoxal phosphate enzyme (YggS family)
MYERKVRENLPRVRDAIDTAARRVGRGEGEVTLVAVTKGHPPGAIRSALTEGIRDIGENRLEEMEEKVGLLGRDAATWHMVGHLQSRKARLAVTLSDLLHSVDTLKLAGRLSGFAVEEGLRVPALVQVNLSGEEAKAGFGSAEAVEAVHEMLELPGLEIRGFMTMAPFVEDEKALRAVFSGLRGIQEESERLTEYQGRELSMGMTNDFEVAVEEGSTMVRIGTALFGERPR